MTRAYRYRSRGTSGFSSPDLGGSFRTSIPHSTCNAMPVAEVSVANSADANADADARCQRNALVPHPQVWLECYRIIYRFLYVARAVCIELKWVHNVHTSTCYLRSDWVPPLGLVCSLCVAYYEVRESSRYRCSTPSRKTGIAIGFERRTMVVAVVVIMIVVTLIGDISIIVLSSEGTVACSLPPLPDSGPAALTALSNASPRALAVLAVERLPDTRRSAPLLDQWP